MVIGDVLEDEGQQVEAEINESGGECLFVPLDVTSQAHWERAVEAAVSRFGTLNILVNNAGIGNPHAVPMVWLPPLRTLRKTNGTG